MQNSFRYPNGNFNLNEIGKSVNVQIVTNDRSSDKERDSSDKKSYKRFGNGYRKVINFFIYKICNSFDINTQTIRK